MTGRVRAAWGGFVAFLDEREGAHPLAVARILAGLTLAGHVYAMWATGVAEAMWVDLEHGGYRPLDPTWFAWVGGATPGVIRAAMAATLVAALCLAAGVFTRAAAVVSWLVFARLCDLNWHCGGSSDELLVNVLFLLALSGCGQAWSVDAWRRGEAREAPAWPRRVMVFQLVLVYLTTALQKLSASWLPGGSLDALWYIVQQPTWQRTDMRWLAPFYPLTQAATLATWLFELSAPLLLLALWYRRTADRPGRVRAVFNRLPFRAAYLGLGLVLHLGIRLTLEVGPFLGGILALYAACIRPSEWRALLTRVRPADVAPAT